MDKNKGLKEEIAALKTIIQRKETEDQEAIRSLESQLRVITAKADILEEESKRKDAEIAHYQLRVTSLGQEDNSRLELEEDLRRAKSLVFHHQKDLKTTKNQLEDALALGKKREEQIRTLIKRIKSLEGESAYWKEEARKKASRVIDLERKLKDQHSPILEDKKQESLEKRLQRALKQLEEKRTELELLKSMVKRVSPERKPAAEVSPAAPKSHLSPGLLPKVHNSPTPVPAAKQWPREELLHVNSKPYISPGRLVRPMLPEASPVYMGVYSSPPLEAIHKNIMNYTPSQWKLPPVEAEEQVLKEESMESRSQGSDLAREDLA